MELLMFFVNRTCIGHRVSVSGARTLILQLRLDRITAVSHCPDVVGGGFAGRSPA